MPNTSDKSLGELLRGCRIEKDLSLRDVAKKLRLAASYLSDIENDRRVPSEEVLKQLADLLGLNFDDLMAQAGRFGDDAQRYMKKHPAAGVMYRKISEYNLPDDDLKQLLDRVDELGRKRKQSSQ